MYRFMLGIVFVLAFVRGAAADEQYGSQLTIIEIGKHKGFILQPAKPAKERPWIWYAPTIGSHPNKSNEWVLRKLLDSGFYVCGINVDESYGSPAGRKVYSDFYQRVIREYKLEPKARLLAQSRGGLMLYNWAAENSDKVRCIVGIYPVCDLRSYPRLTKAAGAYGITPAELEKQLSQHNPIDRLEPLAKAGVPILHIHGDADTVVPLEKNSQVTLDRYSALGGKMKLIVIPGKGHSEIPEYFQEPRLVKFLMEGGFADGFDSTDRKVEPVSNWWGILTEKKLTELAPKTGYITSNGAWKMLWVAWRPNEKLPTVDFAKYLVLVDLGGMYPVTHELRVNDQGDLKIKLSPLVPLERGYGYGITVIERSMVRTIKGKAIEPD